MTIKITGSTMNWTRDCRPRWVLNELEVPYQRVTIALFSGGGQEAEHKAKHPLGKVPVIEDGDAQFWESGAAVLFLAEKYGEGKILPPRDSAARALCYQWIFFAATNLEQACTKLFAAHWFFKDKPDAAQRNQVALDDLAKSRVALDPALAKRPYILGDSFSAADIMIGSSLHWAHKVDGLSDAAPLQSYYQRLAERPAFKKTYSEGED